MRRSGNYYRACNELVSALEEINMWIESMNQAISQLENVTGEERTNLEKYIREEIERLDLKFTSIKKQFFRRLSNTQPVPSNIIEDSVSFPYFKAKL